MQGAGQLGLMSGSHCLMKIPAKSLAAAEHLEGCDQRSRRLLHGEPPAPALAVGLALRTQSLPVQRLWSCQECYLLFIQSAARLEQRTTSKHMIITQLKVGGWGCQA